MSEDNNDDSISIPSDPEVRKRIRDAVAEASAQMQMVDDRKSAIKDIATMAEDTLGVPKKVFNRMVKAFHKQEYKLMVQDDEIFQTFYENIMENTK